MEQYTLSKIHLQTSIFTGLLQLQISAKMYQQKSGLPRIVKFLFVGTQHIAFRWNTAYYLQHISLSADLVC